MESNTRPGAAGTGTALPWNVPLPKLPYPLYPQHQAAPLSVSAHVVDAFAVIVAKRNGVLSASGMWLFYVLPSPSCPAAFRPQQYACPAVVSAQVCSPPLISENANGSEVNAVVVKVDTVPVSIVKP